jgi:hypothetical protein
VLQPVYFELEMNPTLPFPALAPTTHPIAAKPIAATALETYHAVQQADRIRSLDRSVKVGEIELKDRSRWWKIKVRWTVKMGHFLQFEEISGESQTFCALVNSLNKGDRLITPDEWEIFAMLVDDRRNYALRMGAQKCLSRLIHAPKTPERNAATKG